MLEKKNTKKKTIHKYVQIKLSYNGIAEKPFKSIIDYSFLPFLMFFLKETVMPT